MQTVVSHIPAIVTLCLTFAFFLLTLTVLKLYLCWSKTINNYIFIESNDIFGLMPDRLDEPTAINIIVKKKNIIVKKYMRNKR